MIVAEKFWQITSNGGKQLRVYEAEKAPNGNVFHMGGRHTHTHTHIASVQHSFLSSSMQPINNHSLEHLHNDKTIYIYYYKEVFFFAPEIIRRWKETLINARHPHTS